MSKIDSLIRHIEEIKNILLSDKEILSIDDLCSYLQISKNTAYRLTSSKKIKFYRPFGKQIYFAKEDVIDFLKRNPVHDTLSVNQRVNRHLLK